MMLEPIKLLMVDDTLTVESTATAGTVVTLRLPRTEDGAAEGINRPAFGASHAAPHRSSSDIEHRQASTARGNR